MYKKIIGFLAVGVMALAVSTSAFAAEFIAPKHDDNGDLVLSTNETHANLYTAGGTVAVNSTTQGDLFVAGGTITIDGNVEQDLHFAGGTVIAGGEVGGDVRGMGGNVTLTKPVSGDVLVAGGTVLIREGATIGGDLIVAGGTVTVDAPVSGGVKVAGGRVTINNSVGKDVHASVDTLIFESGANVHGVVNYRSAKEADVREGAVVGEVHRTVVAHRDDSNKGWVAALVAGFVIKLLALMLAAYVLLRLVPQKTTHLLSVMQAHPWRNLLLGLVVLVAVPVAVILLLLSVVGYYLAIILIALYALFIVIAGLVATLYVGQLTRRLLNRQHEPLLDWQSAVLGALVFSLIGLIPVVGWVAVGVFYLMGFGGLIALMQEGDGW